MKPTALLFGLMIIVSRVHAGEAIPEPGKVPMLKATTLMEVGAYDEATDTYEISDVKLSGQGPFYATMESLVRVVPSLKLEKLKKNPKSIVSNQYQIEGPLRALAPDERDQLNKKNQTKKNKKP